MNTNNDLTYKIVKKEIIEILKKTFPKRYYRVSDLLKSTEAALLQSEGASTETQENLILDVLWDLSRKEGYINFGAGGFQSPDGFTLNYVHITEKLIDIIKKDKQNKEKPEARKIKTHRIIMALNKIIKWVIKNIILVIFIGVAIIVIAALITHYLIP
jgi:hypothetical protein